MGTVDRGLLWFDADRPPLLGFLIYGVWMLWVTAPEATADRPAPGSARPTRAADPGIPDERPSARGATT